MWTPKEPIGLRKIPLRGEIELYRFSCRFIQLDALISSRFLFPQCKEFPHLPVFFYNIADPKREEIADSQSRIDPQGKEEIIPRVPPL